MPKAVKKTYSDIQQQIAALTEQAEKLRLAEKRDVVDKIKEAIGVYGISLEELFGKSSRRDAKSPGKEAASKPAAGKHSKPGKTSSRAYPKVAAKYKDSAGNTWSGRGSKPRWLADAISTGKSLEDFAI